MKRTLARHVGVRLANLVVLDLVERFDGSGAGRAWQLDEPRGDELGRLARPRGVAVVYTPGAREGWAAQRRSPRRTFAGCRRRPPGPRRPRKRCLARVADVFEQATPARLLPVHTPRATAGVDCSISRVGPAGRYRMSLTAGDRFAGHFEVTGGLGAGSMGEVYRARDTRLNRDVALKLLPDAFAGAGDRLTRFQREAELLASLNHPHIAQIYGIEEDGGVRALVLELVEGPTLEARIARGPLPPDEVLAIATQLADGLEAAHEAGIVHRDLKPANVKVQHDGTVKVLDFGLAKALEAAAPDDRHDPSTWSSADTGLGVVVGTAAYMSPEQARGRAVDRRTDIWAFGAVLFEMLTGRRAFEGDDAAGIFAEVLKAEPAWERLPGDVAPPISAVLRRCLEKEPFQRLRDIADARMGLHGAFEDPERRAAGASGRVAPGRSRRALELAGAAAVAGLAVWLLLPAAPRQPVRFAIEGALGLGPFVEVAPDGGQLAYLEAVEGGSRILVHTLASGEAREVSAAARAGTPLFWSPDSRFVAFADGRTLRRVDVATGAAEAVCDTPVFNGGTWNRDDVILFGGRGGIMQVAAGGGTPSALTAVDDTRGEFTHAAPWFLPDGRHFLYLRASLDSGTGGIYVGATGLEPAEQEPTRLLATERPAVYARSRGSTTGRVFFMKGSRLLAQAFDDARLELAGEPTVVAEDVGSYDVRWRSFSVSGNGIVAWLDGGSAYAVSWLDGGGRELETERIDGLDDPRHPRLSPDEGRLALVVAGDIWVFDLHGDRPAIRLTFDESSDTIGSPLWTPDSAAIVYEGDGSLYQVSADGGSPPKPIGAEGHLHAHAWSPDGGLIAVSISGESGDLVELSLLEEEAEPRALVRTAANEGTAAALSPDGRWLAYTSDATGRREIWVRPYPGPGPPARVSPNGGAEPRWSRDGGTLYYLHGRTMMGTRVETSSGFEFEAPVRLFDGDFRTYERPPSYDVAADGSFVTTRSEGAPSISVLLNWPETLRSRGDGR